MAIRSTRRTAVAVIVFISGLCAQVPPLAESGFKLLFDGKSMSGWDCDPAFFRVEGGEIIGETRADHQPAQNIFCIWKNGTPGNFELKLQYKLTGATGNSGIQYRSV